MRNKFVLSNFFVGSIFLSGILGISTSYLSIYNRQHTINIIDKKTNLNKKIKVNKTFKIDYADMLPYSFSIWERILIKFIVPLESLSKGTSLPFSVK